MIGYYNTMIRYHLGIDPKTLSISEWAEKVAQLEHIRESESRF